jgi:hypothetical protein
VENVCHDVEYEVHDSLEVLVVVEMLELLNAFPSEEIFSEHPQSLLNQSFELV